MEYSCVHGNEPLVYIKFIFLNCNIKMDFCEIVWGYGLD